MPSEALVSVESLSRFYGPHCAVNSLNFSLEKGEILGFLGPNGAGKSTTMQMLTGTLTPTAGAIRINGHDLFEAPLAARACIGYLPEQPPLYKEMKVNEYLHFCARLHGLKGQALQQGLEQARASCGLEQVGQRVIGNLSKGYQQRVGIAQAIIHQPDVVILDEPTVGLDPIQIREIRELIRQLGEQHSVILSTHILPEVQATCTRVQIIRAGSLIYNAPIEALNEAGEVLSLKLGCDRMPESQELEKLPGICRAEVIDAAHFRIHFEGDNPAREIAQIAHQRDWGLFELTPENTSLEQIFVELTQQDPPLPDEENAA